MKYDLTWKQLKQFVRKHKFQTREDYWNYIKKNNLDLPLNPDAKTSQFVKNWTYWQDFLESNLRKTHHRKWRSFKKAREFVHSLELKSSSQWQFYYKNQKLPLDIPTSPPRVYKNQWKGWSDWLGNVTLKDRKFVSFKKAKQWMRDNNIKSYEHWCKVRKQIKPHFIPGDPYREYKKEWKGYGDFFGTGYVSAHLRKYISYKQCSKIAIKNKIKSERQWQRWARTKARTPNIPSNPSEFYKNKGWINWNHFLKTKTKPRKVELTYQEAKDFVSNFNLKSGREYKRFVTKNFTLAKNLPTTPETVYKDQWEGWDKFLLSKRYLDYEQAKKLVQDLKVKSRRHYRKLYKQGKIPKIIPLTPDTVYSRRRSRSW